MKITLRQLSYFTTLAGVGHFGRAAEQLNVTQPALSIQIRELEERLGVTLIMRGRGRGFALTASGHRLLETAHKVLGEVSQLEQVLKRGEQLAGPLNLGMIPTVAPYLLPEVLPELRQSHADVALRLREAQTGLLLADLAEGRLDAALVALPSGADGLIERPLFSEKFLLAGAEAQIARLGARLKEQGAPLRPEALAPEQLLLLDEGHCLADQALAVCGLSRAATSADLGASSLSTLTGLAAAGHGMTFLPEIALASESAQVPGLAVARFGAPEPGRVIGLVRPDLGGASGWFDELASLLAAAGARRLAGAKRL